MSRYEQASHVYLALSIPHSLDAEVPFSDLEE